MIFVSVKVTTFLWLFATRRLNDFFCFPYKKKKLLALVDYSNLSERLLLYIGAQKNLNSKDLIRLAILTKKLILIKPEIS